jgi:predicted PurR-regulated permease PerM
MVMDIGRILIFFPAMIFFFYSFWKHKKDFYLLCGISCWLSVFYVGKHNLHQVLQDSTKATINSISKFFLILVFTLYFIKSFKEIKEIKK